MKKIFFTLITVMISIVSFAQQPVGQRREFKPEDTAKRRADQVKEAAKINDEQYKKVYGLFFEQAKAWQEKMKEAQQGGGRPQFNREEMQKQREATTKALKEILTEEQYQAYEKAEKERRGRFGQGGQRGQRPDGNRPHGQRPPRNN